MSADLSGFLEALWASGAKRQCLSCGQTDIADVRVTAVPKFFPTSGLDDFDDDASAVAIVCAACGFIRFHRIDVATYFD